jgi:PAS domain S-box-containing protein
MHDAYQGLRSMAALVDVEHRPRRIDTMNQEHSHSDPQELTTAPLQHVPFAHLPSITMREITTLLQFSPDALVCIDASGMIVQVNAQAATLFGYCSEELLHRLLETVLPERLREAHVAHRLRYVSTPHPRPMGAGLHLIGRRQDGSEFPIDISLRPVLLDQTLHVLGAPYGSKFAFLSIDRVNECALCAPHESKSF